MEFGSRILLTPWPNYAARQLLKNQNWVGTHFHPQLWILQHSRLSLQLQSQQTYALYLAWIQFSSHLGMSCHVSHTANKSCHKVFGTSPTRFPYHLPPLFGFRKSETLWPPRRYHSLPLWPRVFMSRAYRPHSFPCSDDRPLAMRSSHWLGPPRDAHYKGNSPLVKVSLRSPRVSLGCDGRAL